MDETLKEMLELIANNGFSIFVAVWMLYKDSREKQMLADALDGLKAAVEKLTIKAERD